MMCDLKYTAKLRLFYGKSAKSEYQYHAKQNIFRIFVGLKQSFKQHEKKSTAGRIPAPVDGNDGSICRQHHGHGP
jgi:hypothetical protein